MRTRAFVVVAAAALALAGCGNHALVLEVDVLSYLDPAQRTFHVETVPAVGVPGQRIPLVDQSIQLIEGLDEATDVRSAALSLAGTISVAAGEGSGRLRLYLSEAGGTSSTPVIDAPVAFAAGSPAVVDVSVYARPDVARLFTRKELRLAVTLDDVAIGSTVTDLVVTLGRIEAVVVAGRNVP